jgi:predicted regulator of Ras-like GTPase activity (Roadblock/LC7/MglB family)
MLSFIQKIFGTSKAGAQAPPSTTQQHVEPMAPMPTVEVAQLRLATILRRLPAELKADVLKMPEETVTVALPISTIVKQLPSGVVKVSLATLHRQAPPGVFGPLPHGDKRMVEVPLAEVFRHINPTIFKRRADQRMSDAPESKFNLFGDAQNPYQIAPTAPEEADAEPIPEPPRVLKLEPAPAAPAPAQDFKPAPPPEPPSPPRVIAPPPEFFEPKFVKLTTAPKPTAPLPAPPAGDRPSISIPVEPLSGTWPEPIRQELAALNGSAHVALPAVDVTAGLARGRVTFSWGQIRDWLEPALPAPTNADETTELTLPLKVVAPIFLAATKKPKLVKAPDAFESDIPALFNDARAAAPEPELAPETTAYVEIPPPAPAAEAPVAAAPAPAPSKAPTTVGELFGEPDKSEWTPAEIVAHLAKLPGISGAVVALQEGLLVAHSLPGEVKSEIIAAFLPQLFARLNQYSAEMKLGEVDDLLFTTHGAHCQIYRLGYVYFGVLGKPGEPLPWPELRVVADELARQTQKS